jgi:hypothetical protein
MLRDIFLLSANRELLWGHPASTVDIEVSVPMGTAVRTGSQTTYLSLVLIYKSPEMGAKLEVPKLRVN